MVETQASKTVLKICCKSFLVYLGARDTVSETIAMERFVSWGPADWLDKLLSDSRNGKKSGRDTIDIFCRGG